MWGALRELGLGDGRISADRSPSSTRSGVDAVARLCWRSARVVAPAMLLVAVVGKMASWASTVATLSKLAVALGLAPWAVDERVIGALVLSEAAIGLGLVLSGGTWFRVLAWCGYLLSGVFLTVRLYLSFTGTELRCACFGSLVPTERYTALGLALSVVLFLSMSLLVVRGDPLDAGWRSCSRDGASQGRGGVSLTEE